jgi:hypothetical protein
LPGTWPGTFPGNEFSIEFSIESTLAVSASAGARQNKVPPKILIAKKANIALLLVIATPAEGRVII